MGFHTDVGRQRQKNEDALVEVGVPLGYLLAVADGMGGHDYGDRAAIMALNTIQESLRESTDQPQESLAKSLRKANAVVFKEAEEVGRTMGATCVAGLISGGKLYVAHVGDARAYLLRALTLFPLTRDHSFVQEIADAKGPTMAGNLPQNFTHIVSRSLGTQPSVDVCDREPISLSAGDVILLCSDGLTNMVDDSRIRLTLAGATPREAAKRLVDMANEAGGQDNITVVVARIDTEASLLDTQYIGLNDLRSIFVKTSDGQLHPIVSGLLDPSTWSISAVIIDLRNVKKGLLCTLSISELGPVMYGKQTVSIPQSTEALVEMAETGVWKTDAKRSQPPSAPPAKK